MHDQATCIGCACTDYNACIGPGGSCFWLRVDYTEGKGVCSTCSEHVERWDAGDRSQKAEVRL